MLDYQVFSLNPAGYHIVNLLFHVVNSLMIFLILHRMTKGLWQSAFVAGLFALHPLHVESVAWIAERKDVLSTFFWMLTMAAYLLYAAKPDFKKYFLALFFFALGLMAKPMLVTLPFILLLLDYWPLRRVTLERSPANAAGKSGKAATQHKKKRGRREDAKKAGRSSDIAGPIDRTLPISQIVLEKVPFIVLSLASSIVTFLSQQEAGAMGSLQSYPLSTRFANALVSYCTYIWKMIWPGNLAVLYPHPGVLPIWKIFGAALFLVIATFLVIRATRHFPYLVVGWFWYLDTLIPVIGLVQVGEQSMADRYTYVPLIGIFIMIAWATPEILKNRRQRDAALTAAAVIVLLISSILTWKQLGYWQNSETLFRHALAVTSNNHTAHSNLGFSLLAQGRHEEAIYHYSEAIRIYPNDVDEHNNLGIALQGQGRVKEAISHYLEAIRINPNYIKAYVNLGEALAAQGKAAEAMAMFSKALQIKPDSVEANYNMGTMLLSGGDLKGAVYHFRECIRIKADYAKAYNNLGNALFLEKRIDEAIESFREALRLKPDYALARENLTNALAHQRKSR
ncbi:MAG TPA: tetratricopeptide repeat protein [Syntrophales bacterium]|nr:tetratricopeptide repeat protein [Syntrophales bacterium]